MWIIIIIIAVGYLIYSVTKDKNRDNKENVANYGGMQIKYKQLIDYLTESDFSKLKRISKDNITIQTDSFNATIDYFGGKTEVQIAIKHPVYGYTNKKWKYDDGYPQERIISDVDFHILAVLKNIEKFNLNNNTSDFSKQTDIQEKENSVIRMARNMNCSVDEVKAKYFEDFKDNGFEELGLDFIIQKLELEKYKEAEFFKIDPQNTGSALKIEWTKEYFNTIEIKSTNVLKNYLTKFDVMDRKNLITFVYLFTIADGIYEKDEEVMEKEICQFFEAEVDFCKITSIGVNCALGRVGILYQEDKDWLIEVIKMYILNDLDVNKLNVSFQVLEGGKIDKNYFLSKVL